MHRRPERVRAQPRDDLGTCQQRQTGDAFRPETESDAAVSADRAATQASAGVADGAPVARRAQQQMPAGRSRPAAARIRATGSATQSSRLNATTRPAQPSATGGTSASASQTRGIAAHHAAARRSPARHRPCRTAATDSAASRHAARERQIASPAPTGPVRAPAYPAVPPTRASHLPRGRAEFDHRAGDRADQCKARFGQRPGLAGRRCFGSEGSQAPQWSRT